MSPPEDVPAVIVTRIEGKIDVLTARMDAQSKQHSMSDAQLQRAMDGLRDAIKEAREESRRDTNGVREALEMQINGVTLDQADHEHAVNPHPQQEEWLRGDIKALGAEVRLMRSSLDSARGGGRVLWTLAGAVGATALAVVSGVLVQALR